VDAAPDDARVNVERKGDAVAVSDAAAAGGRHSLRVGDAPGLQHVFNPHVVYTPQYVDGTARCAFDLRVEEGAVMYHEWRDWSQPSYLVGPSLWIQQGQPQVPGQPPRTFAELAFGSPQFHRLTWVGFISNADARTVFYIDNLKLSCAAH